MIVLHGVAGLADEVSEYTLSIDNSRYEIIPGEETLHDHIVYSNVNGRARTDGTSVGKGAIVKIDIKTSNVAEISVKSGSCTGEKNTLQTSSDAGELDKESYLAEMAAFMRTGRVDFSLNSVGYNSPLSGMVFSLWTSDVPEDGLGIKENKSGNLNVTIVKSGEDSFTMEYDTKELLSAQGDCDWYVAHSIELTVDIITKKGAIAAGEKISYFHNDAPIASCVNVTDTKFLTFDSDIAVIGGWWESSDVAVRRRHIAKEGIATRDSMFRYLIFGNIAPSIFSSSLRNMVFTASRSGSAYVMDRVLTNNMYDCPNLGGMGIVSSGPEISGSAHIIPDADTGSISIDTSEVRTSMKEMYVVLSDGGSVNSCKFQLKSGLSPSAGFIIAAADSRVVYNQITGRGTFGVAGVNVDNMLIGFHLFVSGLQGYLIDSNTWGILGIVLGYMTRGLSCIFTGNMMEFVFFLYYESIKNILNDSERRMIMGEIAGVQEHYLASMAKTQVGIDASVRKKIARQWLEMTDSNYMRKSSPTISRIFPLTIFCVTIPMDMPDYIPYTLGLPMYGVPLYEDVAESASTPGQIMTEAMYSMMSKNAHYTLYRTRMDWAMALGGRLGAFSTYWAWGGTLVTIKRDGKHRELYSASDPAYAMHSTLNESFVAVDGVIGEKWDEFREAMIPTTRFNYWNKKAPVAGVAAGSAIEEWRTDDVTVMFGMVGSRVIDLDNDTITINGGEAIDVIIHRPNPDVIIAFEKA